MATPPPLNYTVARDRSGDVTTLVGNGRRKFGDDLGAPKLCCAYQIKADPANSVNVLVGEGSAPMYPLVPGEVAFTDLPPGVLVDISTIVALDATKTGGQILHVRYWEVVGNPPQGTAKPGGQPDDLNGPPDHYAGAGA